MISRGSEWRRWEPHIHAPGTVMNNQFGGPDAWDTYLTALEQATPLIEAIAVTDYYVTDTYEEVLRQKAAGGCPAAKLIFPNVELRLDVARRRAGSSICICSSARRILSMSWSCSRILSRLQIQRHAGSFRLHAD